MIVNLSAFEQYGRSQNFFYSFSHIRYVEMTCEFYRYFEEIAWGKKEVCRGLLDWGKLRAECLEEKACLKTYVGACYSIDAKAGTLNMEARGKYIDVARAPTDPIRELSRWKTCIDIAWRVCMFFREKLGRCRQRGLCLEGSTWLLRTDTGGKATIS